MSKLFKIKEWITVPDAAKNLSVTLGEEVTEIDVLHLALEGKLSLSVRVSSQIPAKMAQIVQSIPEDVHGQGHFATFDGILTVTDDQIVMIDGLFDMQPQTFANRNAMENAYRRVLGLEMMEIKGVDEIILIDKNGLLYVPQILLADNRISATKEELTCDFISRKIARECYFDAQEIGTECALVVRTSALREFEKSISDQPAPAVRDESLLAVIAALLAQWPNGKPPTGKDLEKAAQAIGLKISDDTIRKALKAARDIAPSLPA